MPNVEVSLVKEAASGRWPEILSRLAGVDQSILDGRHHPCPKCGGTDRFRAFDDGTGGALCNQCFATKNGDGFAVLQWLTGDDFGQSLQRVADYVGVRSTNGKGRGAKANPEEHLQFSDLDITLTSMWAAKKAPIQPSAVFEFGGLQARYRHQFDTVAIPIWGPNGTEKAVGWVLYNLNGQTLPKYGKKGQPPEYIKVKIAFGSQTGIVCSAFRLNDLDRITTIVKCEGVTDALALAAIVPPDHLVISNSNGAEQRPLKWITKLAKGKRVIVVHDCDRPGQDGATYVGEPDGRQRKGWCPEFLEAGATEVINLVLPYPIAPNHGPDVRDWLNEPHTWKDFEELAGQADPFTADSAGSVSEVVEAWDDPHRLARVNMHRYQAMHGGHLRYWRDEWYQWKRTRYRKIGRAELRAKVHKSLKLIFDDHFRETQDERTEQKPVKKITRTIVNDVISATEAESIVSDHVELGTWLDQDIRERRRYLALQNGLLDVEALLDGKNDVMLEHSHKWFSATCLPYRFDVSATCPRWYSFLERNLEGDEERMKLVQEWAGYLLFPETGQQRFLIMEGEGANGKSVYCSAIEAMLGEDNCTHVPLEVFGDRFSRTQTLGKLACIASDVGEIDKIAEGYVKSFTSGEKMFFDRKGIAGLDAYPTARLMLACNNRPRFSDRSGGIWRRVMILPWNIQIPEGERVQNMDKPWWWEQSGELPGILNWALHGWLRLRKQGVFTVSKIAEDAVDDYQREANPAREFLVEHYQTNADGGTELCAEVYDRYQKWCRNNGYRPLASRTFGKEVRRVFRRMKRVRLSLGAARAWAYGGIRKITEGNEDEFDA